MGRVIPFKPHHARASRGRAASISNVTGCLFLFAKPTTSGQRQGGIPYRRQVLTVGKGTPSACATSRVPPSFSIKASAVAADMPAVIVRTVRTCQAFADCDATFRQVRVPVDGMYDPPETIGPRLRALRIACGFKSQARFAREIGVERNTYNPWEKGKRALTFEGALLIRKRFHVPLDYLFFGDAVDEIPAGILQRLQQAA